MKICSKCKHAKLLQEFSKQKACKDGHSPWCKKCALAYNKEYCRKNKDKVARWCKKSREKRKKRDLKGYKRSYRNTQLKYLYNITLEDYDKLFKQQRGCCSVCKRPQSKLTRTLAVDHNHQTGKIRGLLCDLCNLNMEWYEKNKWRLEQYLIAKELAKKR